MIENAPTHDSKKARGTSTTLGDVLFAKTFRLPFKVPVHLRGYSRGGDITCFCIPEWKIQLDAGEFVHFSSSSYFRPSVILITDPHIDHSFCLPIALINPSLKIRVLVPHASAPSIEKFVANTYLMNGCGTPEDTIVRDIVGMKNGETIRLAVGKNSREVLVRAFEMEHPVPCLAFGIYEQGHRLKAEYRDRMNDLAALRKQHVQLEDYIDVPMLMYIGSSTLRGLQRIEQEMSVFPVVVTTCTFLEEKHRSPNDPHLCFADVAPLIQRYKEITFVLTHFSLRYSCEELEKFFQARTLEFPNIVPWICGEE